MSATFEIDNYFEERGGSWDESGLVESLDRKGFTPNKCCSELIANSNDAQATKIIWKIDSKHIKLIDDGIGMDRNKLQDMFKMFKSNNSERKTMGVSGLGGKEGIYILSKKTNKQPTSVIIYTQVESGEYLKAIIPWKEVFDKKVYTGKITFMNMLPEEIVSFNNDLKDCKFKHGTIILFEYNDELKNIIEQQFSIDKMCRSFISPHSRWDMIFGHADSEIVLEKTDGTPPLRINKYDYFSGNDIDFYTGKSVDIIHQFIDDKNEDRYVLISDDGPKEIYHHGKNGFKTEPSDVRIHQTWTNVGSYEVFNGLRVDKRIFDLENPTELSTGSTFLNSYDSQYFTPWFDAEFVKESLSGCSVYRNSQLITKISFDDKTFNAKTSRGGGDSMLNKFHHRTEIRYTTYSKQNNRMDITMGIQENKNQHQNTLPKQLERLIVHLKRENLKKINHYFKCVIQTKLEQDKEKRRLAVEQKKIEEEQKRLATKQKKIEEEQKRIESKTPFVSSSSASSNEEKVVQIVIEEDEDQEEVVEDVEEHVDEDPEDVEEDPEDVEDEEVKNEILNINEQESMPELSQLKPISLETIVEILHEKYNNDDETLLKIYNFINSL